MTDFEQMIRDAGEGWLIDTFAPPTQAIKDLMALLESADEEYRKRFGQSGPAITPDILKKVFKGNSQRVRAFLQALGATHNPQMLVMVWRILLGASIAEVLLNYTIEKQFHLTVKLFSASGEEETYESNDIDDAALLRHLGIMKMDGRPIFEGFFALNVKA